MAPHPSIATLEAYARQVKWLTGELDRWDGRANGVYPIFDHSAEAVSTLRQAAKQMRDSMGIDFFSSAAGFMKVSGEMSGIAKAYSVSVQAKLPQFKAIRQQQKMYEYLDGAFAEGTAYFAAAREKMPKVVFSSLDLYHSQVLATLGQAREAFRPGKETVIVVVDGGPGQPPYTYTLPPGAPMPTIMPSRPNNPYTFPTYTPAPQYPQAPWSPDFSQENPWRPQPDYSPNNPWAPEPGYSPYNPFPQYTQRGPKNSPLTPGKPHA